MKVRELIEELKNYNPEATVTVGDNFYNGIDISYGYSDGCTKENCEFVCFDKENNTKENEKQEIKERFLRDTDETGRCIVKSIKTGRTYHVDPINNSVYSSGLCDYGTTRMNIENESDLEWVLLIDKEIEANTDENGNLNI